MRTLATFVLVVVLGVLVSAQTEPTGLWRGQTSTGTVMELELLTQNGVVTGSLAIGPARATLADGRVSNGTFSFSVMLASTKPRRFAGEMASDAITLWMTEQGRAQAITLTRAPH